MFGLPANRVAAIAGFLSSLATAILGMTSSLPQKWQSGSALIAGVLGQIVVVLHFMSGSHKFDKLQAEREKSIPGFNVETMLKQIQDQENAQDVFQSKPGTPAHLVSSGLAPSDGPIS